MTVLILIILVLVIVVAIKDQDKDAKIAEVDKKATDSILKREKDSVILGTVRLVIQRHLCIKFSSGEYPKVVSVYSTGWASKTQKSSMGDYEIVPGLTVRAFPLKNNSSTSSI